MPGIEPRERRRKLVPMPDRLAPDEVEALLAWGARKGFTLEEIRYGVTSVREWAATRPKEPLRPGWVRTIQRSIREGWALRGCKAELLRTSKQINPRTGEKIVPRTAITPAVIQREVNRAVLRRQQEE